MLEAEAEEVQSGRLGHDTARVAGDTTLIEHRRVDPRIVGHEPGAPHDRARPQHLAVDDRPPVEFPLHSTDADDACVDQYALGNPDQGVPSPADAPAYLPTQSR